MDLVEGIGACSDQQCQLKQRVETFCDDNDDDDDVDDDADDDDDDDDDDCAVTSSAS